jgi:hypothetical protein
MAAMARCETCGAELQDASQRLCGGDRCRGVFMKHPTSGTSGSGPAARYDMAMLYKVVTVLALIFLVSLVTTRAADGEVPTRADFAACNEEAPHAVKAGMASPIKADYVRADNVRGGAMTTNSTDFTGPVIESSDPQIHGMEAEGAKNATYQAAYRGCMRRKGF